VLVPQQDDAQGRHEEKFRIARRLQHSGGRQTLRVVASYFRS
jgi:hypothetical protein